MVWAKTSWATARGESTRVRRSSMRSALTRLKSPAVKAGRSRTALARSSAAGSCARRLDMVSAAPSRSTPTLSAAPAFSSASASASADSVPALSSIRSAVSAARPERACAAPASAMSTCIATSGKRWFSIKTTRAPFASFHSRADGGTYAVSASGAGGRDQSTPAVAQGTPSSMTPALPLPLPAEPLPSPGPTCTTVVRHDAAAADSEASAASARGSVGFTGPPCRPLALPVSRS
jgi:hypothetical protein